MFFIASKLLWIALDPINLAIVVAFLAAAWRRYRIAAGAAAALLIMGFSPLGVLALAALENRFPDPPPDAPAPYGLIVLGGAIDDAVGAARGQIVVGDGGSRLTEAAALARRFPQARLLYTGGSGSLIAARSDEAEQAKRLWTDLGVAADRISTEEKSRNTEENARFSAVLLGEDRHKTWWIVTSAFHMPRAMGLFRRAGFDPVAYPVDFRTFGDIRDARPLASAAEGFRATEISLHEWTGLFAYWATGRIGAPFPSP